MTSRSRSPVSPLSAVLAAIALVGDPCAQDPDGQPAPRQRMSREDERDAQRARMAESTSTRTEDPALEAPSSVSILLGRDVWRSGARYLSDALRQIPGIEVQRISATESNVSLRGYMDTSTAAQGVPAKLDGRNVYNEFVGTVLWDQLPVALDDIERIEVLRGPASAVEGPNAMHGLVLIETRSPLDYDRDHASLRADLGTNGSVVSRLTHVHRGESSGLKTTVQWDDIDGFEDADVARRKGFFETRYETRLGADGDARLEFAGGVSDQSFNTLIPTLFIVPRTLFRSDAQETFARTRYRTEELDLRLSWTGFDVATVPPSTYTPFRADVDTVDLDLQWTLPGTGDHRVTVGTGLRHATFATEDFDVSNGRHTTDLGWLFAQDEFRLSDRWTWTASARVDGHSETGVHVAPRLAAVWEVDELQYLRASGGWGYRNPSLRELWFEMPVTVPGQPPVFVDGNGDLEPESLTSLELGYLGSWGAPEGAPDESELELGATVFYNFVENLVSFEPTAPDRVAPQNTDDEDAYGFELEGRCAFSRSLSAFANYAYVRRSDVEDTRRDARPPRSKANAGLTLSTDSGFRAMLWAHYYDHTEVIGLKVDDYVLVNGSLSWVFDVGGSEGSAFVRVFNLLDDRHREHPEGSDYGLLLSAGVSIEF